MKLNKRYFAFVDKNQTNQCLSSSYATRKRIYCSNVLSVINQSESSAVTIVAFAALFYGDTVWSNSC